MSSIKKKFHHFLFFIFVIIWSFSCEEDRKSDCCDSINELVHSCFPAETSDKLRICLSTGKIQCPNDRTDCYRDLGEFYSVWRPFLHTLDSDYETFRDHDTLISGIFVDTDNTGEQGLPACNLPLPPPGGDVYNNDRLNSKNNVLYASIVSIEDASSDFLLPDQHIIFCEPETPGSPGDSITITKFDYADAGISDAYNFMLLYYDREIIAEGDASIAMGKDGVPLIVPSGLPLTLDVAYLKHSNQIFTYIIKSNETSFVRIRFKSSFPIINSIVEFYE